MAANTEKAVGKPGEASKAKPEAASVEDSVSGEASKAKPEAAGTADGKPSGAPKVSLWNLFYQSKKSQEGMSRNKALEMWKSMGPHERETFKASIEVATTSSSAEVALEREKFGASQQEESALLIEDSKVLHVDQDYDLKLLLKNFGGKSSHAHIMKDDQRRWELYGTVATLMSRGLKGFDKVSHVVEIPQLRKLQLNRNKLSAVCKQLAADKSLPSTCPQSFRTGRSPDTQLTLAEKQLFLQFIQWHAQHGNACSVRTCHNALTLWAMEKKGVLQDVLDDPDGMEARLDTLLLGLPRAFLWSIHLF